MLNKIKFSETTKKRIVDTLLYLGIIYLSIQFLRLFCLASFKIPSDSMQPALIPGDHILVNKTIPGARIFDITASIKGERVKIWRTPGLRKLKRNDIIVFNIPYPDKSDTIRMDIMKYYVKRCIALPGDTFYIQNGIYKIKGIQEPLGNTKAQRQLPNIRHQYPEWMFIGLNGWDITQFGPLIIPQKGSTIPINNDNIKIYEHLIHFETGQTIKTDGEKITLNGQPIYNYTFTKNYYFTAGDNVADSQDSRYWGLLPEEYIVGKAWIIWKSVDQYNNTLRWNRFLRKIQ